MVSLFASDRHIARANALRPLLARLEAATGEDRVLGADILNALGAPMLIGDATGSMDSAFNLAAWLRCARGDLLHRAAIQIKVRVARGGWKQADQVCSADVARTMTLIVLRVELAKLERSPV